MEPLEYNGRQVTVIIPTRNRPEMLSKLLQRLSEISDEFHRIIVVDSSTPEFSERASLAIEQSGPIREAITFLHTNEASLTRQKNLGLGLCASTDLVQILDDDVLPPKGYIESMKASLSQHGLAGISGVIQEIAPKNFAQKTFGYLFGLISLRPGEVSIGGLGTPVLPNTKTSGLVPVTWLIGCSMWDLCEIQSERYHDGFIGSAQFEDVEFSYRISRFAKLAIDPNQVLIHHLSPEGRPDQYTFWLRFSRNRYEVIRLRSKIPRVVFLWSSLGLIIQIFLGNQNRKLDSIRGLTKGVFIATKQGKYL
jgi:GT2 family glycosyltransferase